jgi:class 3 adenylate cyclase/tetratricopeptide (TPR) repeat protein
MRCPRCGFKNPEGMRFCGQCASPLGRRCPQCGFDNPPGFAFCGQCATPLTELPPASRPQAPLSYTPSHLVEKILTSKTALEGERKQVTVLFADLKGSMELLADRDPEDARAILDPVLEHMMAAVHRYEGTVNQVMGDGIMALFGAPIAHEDHAVRACYAALAMQAALRRYSDEVRRTHGLAVDFRVGLNSGEVVMRAIDHDLHIDYSAIGQTVHLAARMEQMATPGNIALTPATVRLVEGLVRLNPLGPVPVKGLAEPVEVFEVVGATAVRQRFRATAAHGLTRFIGRETEMTVLARALARAGAGHGQVVALVGEPGVGKSRLVYECVHSPRTQGWSVLEAASVSYGKATPYFPVVDLLKRYLHIEEGDGPRTLRVKVTGHLLTLDEALQETIPALLALLDVLPPDSPFLTLDPPQRRQRTLAALKRVLLRESQVQPLLLVFEDLHWIDAETQALLDSLVESLPTAHMLLLVNYRPEYQHGWGSKTYYTQLRLDPLPPASADELLQALLGDDPSLAPLKQLLIARTEGNPFFLEESVHTLVETGVLIGERGAYRLAQALASLQVPATVQAVVAARLDRLPPEEKRLLQTAAVIGTEVPLPLLQAIADLSEAALHRGLAHLQAAEFLYETRLFPDHEYTFKHALTHEVAYNSLLQERRRALHAGIVEALETLAGDRVTEQVERLAYHALRGEVWDKTLVYCQLAGQQAFQRAAYQEAVAFYEQALHALPQLPTTPDALAQAIDLRFDLRKALWPLAEFGQLLDHLRAAARLAETLQDQRRLAWSLSHLTGCFMMMGEHSAAIESGQRALTIASTLKEVALQAATTIYLGRAYRALGDYDRAIALLTRTVVSLQGELLYERFDLPTVPAVSARAWLAHCLAELGEFPQGIARGEEAVRLAESVDDPSSLIVAYAGIGGLYLCQGDVHQAISALEQGLRICRDTMPDNRFLFRMVASCLGYVYALSGRIAEGLPLLEEAIKRAPSRRVEVSNRQNLAWLGEAYLMAGHQDDAMDLAGQVLKLSRASNERGHQAYALRLLGEIAARREPPESDQTEGHYRQALALAEELGMRPLQAHCHLGLGTFYAKISQREEACTELATAIEMYRAMDMTFWLPQAEAAVAVVEGR